MHEPSDSSLLWDAVRVTARLLETADTLVGGLEWRNHRRAAKKRARIIEYARDRRKRVQHYRELIKLTRATLGYADQASAQLWRAADPMAAAPWQAEFRHYRPNGADHRADRTSRSSWRGGRRQRNNRQPVQAACRHHRRPRRSIRSQAQPDHRSNWLDRRPRDRGRQSRGQRTVFPMLKRHIAIYREAPRQTSADGGFASRDSLAQAKDLGVHDAAFTRKPGCRHRPVQKQLGLSQATQLPGRHRSRPSVRRPRSMEEAAVMWTGLRSSLPTRDAPCRRV